MCATVLSLAAVEVAVRLLPVAAVQRFDLRWSVQPDSLLGWRHLPGASRRFVTAEYSHDITYNAHGIRGPERSYQRPLDVRRIVMLGDSFVDGTSVPEETRVSAKLETLLNDAGLGYRTEVIPLGTNGYSTDQELLSLQTDGWSYEPDLVILMFYENDVWFNGESAQGNSKKPLFVLENGRLRLTGVPVPPPDRPSTQAVNGLQSLTMWIESNSRAYSWTKATIKSNPNLARLAIKLGLSWPEDDIREYRTGLHKELQVWATKPSADIEARWQLTQALLRHMGDEVRAKGARFLAFLIPTRISVYPEEWNTVRSAMGLSIQDWSPAMVASRFVTMCGAESLECLEPTARFIQSAERGRAEARLYYKGDSHWNPNGHNLAAEILAEWIRSNAPDVRRAK